MRARQILLFLFVLTLYGTLAYTGYRIFLIALLLIVFLVIASLVQLLWMRNRIEVTGSLTQNPVYTGEATALSLTVVNRSRWPVAALEIEIQQDQYEPTVTDAPDDEILPVKSLAKALRFFKNQGRADRKPLVDRRRILSIFGRGSLVEKMELVTDEARLYRVSVSRMRLRDPFDMIRLPVGKKVWRQVPDMRLFVFPKPDDLLSVDSLHRIRLAGLQTSSRQSDEINTVDDLRLMQPGDALKRIHWIVSAKQNEWMIKKFEKEEQGHVLLVTDLFRDHLPQRLYKVHRNRILSLAAAAAQSFLGGELSLLLSTDYHGPIISQADRTDQLTDLMVQLATAQDNPVDSLTRQAQAGLSRLPDNGSVVLVTANADDSLVKTSEALIRQGFFVTLIFLAFDFESTDEQTEWLRRYRNTGADLIVMEEHESAD